MNDGSGKVRILIVDDDRSTRDCFAFYLEHGGYTVHAAEDGEQALMIAPQFKPDLAIIDVGLPNMDGIELAAHLRKLFRAGAPIKLIALSGWDQHELKKHLRGTDFDMYLVKPIQLDNLKNLVVNLLAAEQDQLQHEHLRTGA